ncbi:MAG: hypothetical protein ACE3L7_24785 [Candidatus Pristimantibacillus sp.]
MRTATDLHHTKEAVTESGKYVCAVGETREFKEGDKFSACPQSGRDTTWRHASHQHKTGDKVTEAGRYIDADGERTSLKMGDTFPSCSKSGNATTWSHE